MKLTQSLNFCTLGLQKKNHSHLQTWLSTLKICTVSHTYAHAHMRAHTHKHRFLLRDLTNTWIDGYITRVTTGSGFQLSWISSFQAGGYSTLWSPWWYTRVLNLILRGTKYMLLHLEFREKITDTQNSDWRKYTIKGSFWWPVKL